MDVAGKDSKITGIRKDSFEETNKTNKRKKGRETKQSF